MKAKKSAPVGSTRRYTRAGQGTFEGWTSNRAYYMVMQEEHFLDGLAEGWFSERIGNPPNADALYALAYAPERLPGLQVFYPDEVK